MLEFKNQARTNDVKEISGTTDTKKKKEKTEQGVKRIKWKKKKSGSNRKKLTATRKAGF